MSNWLKQSTAAAISFGPFVSPTDAVTLVTSLVSALDHASTGIFLSKNGGALTIRHATVTASTYDAYGNYIVTLDATDTNTLGRLRVQFAAAASCLPVWRDYEIVAANIYDSFIGGGDVLDVSLIQWLGTAPVALSSQLVQVANSAGTATILADYARRTGDYATVAALSTLQGNVTTILADYARRTGDYATVAALATLQGNVTSILTDYARRTGDYATVAALTALQGNVTTILTDYARRTGDYATQASVDTVDDLLDTEIAAIKSDTAAILADTGTDGVIVASGSKTGYSLASGQIFVKKNTALSGFMFTMLDEATGVPATGFTVTATRSIDGAAFAACANAVTAVSNGWYKINFAAADLNGTVIAFRMTATGALERDFSIVTQA